MIRRLTFAFLGFVTLAGCGDDSAPMTDSGVAIDSSTAMDGGDTDGGTTTRTLSMIFDGLPDLGADYVYEGWLIVADAPVSTGRFAIDGSGAPDPATSTVMASDADAATLFVLTIESATGDDPAPSDTHILAGPMASGVATLTTDHMGALGSDFSAATGEFVLNTPSTAATDDAGLGIWWLKPPMPFTAGLALPPLPAGWAYEGWVVDASGPVSTGRFTAVDATDADAAGATAGPDGAGPPFPGQDFITPARDLTTGHMAVISVEPQPDNSPMPFAIKPLVGTIDATLAPATQTMGNMAAASLPSGSVRIE